MNYKAKNVDTDKALEYIEWSRKYQDESERLELAKIQKYYEGVRKGLDVLSAIYELGKELDIPTQDLRDNFSSVDEICAVLASRIEDKEECTNN